MRLYCLTIKVVIKSCTTNRFVKQYNGISSLTELQHGSLDEDIPPLGLGFSVQSVLHLTNSSF